MINFFFLRKPSQKMKKPLVFPLKAGEIRIYPRAVEDLVKRSLSGLSGLNKYNSSIRQEDEGLEISIYCQFDDGYDILLVSANIREKVQVYVEQKAGISVKEVRVFKT